MPGDFDAYLRSPPRWGFNFLSFTAEPSVIGSEAERNRMLIGGRGGGGYWTPAGDSVEERASNMLSWTVTGYIMFDGNSMGSLRSDDGDGNENGKKSNRFSASPDDPG